MDKGNGLETYLKEHGFKREGTNIFSSREPEQLIELSASEQGTSYVNHLNKNDNGRYIQFLQNRMLSTDYIIPNQDMGTFLITVKLALILEEANTVNEAQTEKRSPKPIKAAPVKRRGKML